MSDMVSDLLLSNNRAIEGISNILSKLSFIIDKMYDNNATKKDIQYLDEIKTDIYKINLILEQVKASNTDSINTNSSIQKEVVLIRSNLEKINVDMQTIKNCSNYLDQISMLLTDDKVGGVVRTKEDLRRQVIVNNWIYDIVNELQVNKIEITGKQIAELLNTGIRLSIMFEKFHHYRYIIMTSISIIFIFFTFNDKIIDLLHKLLAMLQ